MIMIKENQLFRKSLSQFYCLRNKSLLKTIPTWTELGSNPDLGSERLATYRLNHGKDSLKVTDKVAYPDRRTSNVTRL